MTRIRVLCVVLMLAGGALAQRWVTPAETTNFRYTRFDGEYFPGTGKVYFLGGRLYDATTTGKIWSYDPATRTYDSTGLGSLPAPISNYDICLLRDMHSLPTDSFGLYVVGSRNAAAVNIDTVQVYYPKSNTTRIVSTDSFPGRIGGATYAALGSVVAGNKIYEMGGFLPTTWVSTNQCFVFDPLAAAGTKWSTLPNLSVARCYVSGAVIDDTLLYAIGGDTANMVNASLYATAIVERLNLHNISAGWTTVTSLPIICGETRAFSFQRADSLLGFSRKIIVAGVGQWPAESANCYIYDVAGNSWSSFPKLDSARRNHAGAYIPGTAGTNGVPGIWVWGGRKTSDAIVLATPEYYALGLNVGVTRIMAPTGGVDSGASVTPACSVYNYGAANATYKVRLQIGGHTDSATVTNHAAGTKVYVTFPNWTVNAPRGNCAVACSTRCGNDFDQSNDKQTGTVTVNVHDVGMRAIVVPTGTLDSVATIAPACSVYNYGNTTENYTVRMKIGTGYDTTGSVSVHAPGTVQYVTFPLWTVGPRGSYATLCSTKLTTDMYWGNDRMAGTVTIRVQDVGATAIVAPAGTVPTNQVVTPQLKVKNLGGSPATFGVQLVIKSGGAPVYTDSGTVVALAGGAEATVSFSQTWTATPAGDYTTVAWTKLSGDANPANDTIRNSFTVGAGGGGRWTLKTPMPSGGKPVKDGGWLTYNLSTNLVYASRGNRQADFFSWNPAHDSWKALSPWLPGTEGKLPKAGSAGCADGGGHVYATKGNNTRGFYVYDATANTWTQKKDVPLGLSNKKIKGGTALAWGYKDSVGSPYLLKGYKNEFYKYVVAGDSWQTLTPAPIGSNVKWDKGSWLACDSADNRIYAFKAKYMEFYYYNPEKDSWSPALASMPIPGSAGSKKAKDGGCGTCVCATPPLPDSFPAIYAFKGGNTREWWMYSIPKNAWTEKDTIPTGSFKKKVKSGASVTTVPLPHGDMPGTPAEIPALKGNSTNELWVYGIIPPLDLVTGNAPNRDGVAAEKRLLDEPFLALVPNPLSGRFVTLRYSLPGSGLAMVRVYDVTGRPALPAALITGRNGTAQLDLRSLSAGVYLLKVEGTSFTTVRKLVLER